MVGHARLLNGSRHFRVGLSVACAWKVPKIYESYVGAQTRSVEPGSTITRTMRIWSAIGRQAVVHREIVDKAVLVGIRELVVAAGGLGEFGLGHGLGLGFEVSGLLRDGCFRER